MQNYFDYNRIMKENVVSIKSTSVLCWYSLFGFILHRDYSHQFFSPVEANASRVLLIL